MKIVIKVGTSLITNEKGLLKPEKIKKIVKQISNLAKNPDNHLLLVSSGAISAGMAVLGISVRPSQIDVLQAAAAVGQGKLINIYDKYFEKYGLRIAQVLITMHDTTHRAQYLNSKQTLSALSQMNVIPIINENDSVATEEIIRGDNDTLAGIVANIAEADLLIILSDVDGLMTSLEEGGEVINEVDKITPEILEMAKDTTSDLAKGGMETKLQAAEIATLGQADVIIANGDEPDILEKIIIKKEKVGTHFKPAKKKLTGRKLWIAFSASERFTKGTLIVDEGAQKALIERGKSLLSAGIKKVLSKKGFRAGDIIDLAGYDKKIFARGVSNYSSEEIERIKGKKSKDIEIEIPFDEVVHRDDLVILPITQQMTIREV